MKKRSSKRQSSGVVAIEFAIGAFAFFMMIFYWMEVSYMGFVSAMVDYSVTVASRHAKMSETNDYKAVFQKILTETDSPWAAFLDSNKFTMTNHHYGSIDGLGCGYTPDNDECKSGGSGDSSVDNARDKPLAIYRVSYPYSPLFAQLFFDGAGSMTISREVITIQEYQRDKFYFYRGL